MSRVHSADAAIIHGGGITQTVPGEWRPSHASITRATTGIHLVEDGVVDQLILTGNNAHGDILPITEARSMAEIAIEYGIPPEKIIVLEKSTSTLGNLAEALTEAKIRNIERLIGVTGRIACFRANNIGQIINKQWELGRDLAGYVASEEKEGVVAYPRELVALSMSRRCIANAQIDGIALEDLDTYYLERKANSRLAVVKRHLASYPY